MMRIGSLFNTGRPSNFHAWPISDTMTTPSPAQALETLATLVKRSIAQTLADPNMARGVNAVAITMGKTPQDVARAKAINSLLLELFDQLEWTEPDRFSCIEVLASIVKFDADNRARQCIEADAYH